MEWKSAPSGGGLSIDQVNARVIALRTSGVSLSIATNGVFTVTLEQQLANGDAANKSQGFNISNFDVTKLGQMPSITSGDSGRRLAVNAAEDAFVLVDAPGAGVTPRTNEEIRDVSYAGFRAGAGMAIDVDDAANTATFTASTSFESVANLSTLILIDNGGDVLAVNREDPNDLYTAASLSGFTQIRAATRVNNRIYFVETATDPARLYYLQLSQLGTAVFVGNLPSSMTHDEIRGMGYDGTKTYIFESGSGARMWEVDLTTPSSSTVAYTNTTPSLENHFDASDAATIHEGNWYFWRNVTAALFRSPSADLNDAVSLGIMPPAAGAWTGAGSWEGNLYVVQATGIERTLWRVDTGNPSNSTNLGDTATEFSLGPIVGANLPLTTRLVPEDGNLYYTDARVDARILPTARTANTDRWAKNKLPSDIFYGTPSGGVDPAEWAKASNPTGTAPKDRLPSDVVYDADLAGLSGSGPILG